MFNKVVLVGNLTRDIELRYAQNGSAIANTAIATSRKFTQNGEKKEEVCFMDITFFARSAEVANQYLRRGSKILVEGRIKFDQWQAQDGSKRSKHSVIVETMQMLDSKSDETASAPQDGDYEKWRTDYNAPAPQPEPAKGLTPEYEAANGQSQTKEQQNFDMANSEGNKNEIPV